MAEAKKVGVGVIGCGTEETIRGDVLTGEIEYKRISHKKPVMRETTVGGTRQRRSH